MNKLIIKIEKYSDDKNKIYAIIGMDLEGRKEDDIFLMLGEWKRIDTLNDKKTFWDKINRYIKKGRKWFQKQGLEFQSKVCSSEFVKKEISSVGIIDFVASILEIIGDGQKTLRYIASSWLIAKSGLSLFCKNVQV